MKKSKYIYFKNHYKQEMVPFVIYADFEYFNVPINMSQTNPEKSYTKPYQKHVPSGFAYKIVLISKIEQYRGKDAAEVFIKRLKKDISDIVKIPSKEMEDLTPEQQDQYGNATTCNGEFTEDDEEKNYKVRENNRYTGEFRGAAHNLCNLSHRRPTLSLFSVTTLEVIMDT